MRKIIIISLLFLVLCCKKDNSAPHNATISLTVNGKQTSFSTGVCYYNQRDNLLYIIYDSQDGEYRQLQLTLQSVSQYVNKQTAKIGVDLVPANATTAADSYNSQKGVDATLSPFTISPDKLHIIMSATLIRAKDQVQVNITATATDFRR